MKLIVDSNRVIAGLIRDGIARRILLHPGFQFYAPEFMLLEIKNLADIIIEKSGLSPDEFARIFSLLVSKIKLVPKVQIEAVLKEAEATMGKIDIGDVPFLAAALAIPNDGIWSEDKHFEKQSEIKVWKTAALLHLI
ncbi:MAG: PIN domain-containing protein [Candidatus Heimdallarchaeota archaeon]